jgi:hypothetical protein
MKLALCALILAVVLLGCATANVGNVPELPGDLSLTEPPEYPGYLLIAPSDLSRIMTRMREAETKVRENYIENGTAIP